MRRIDRIHAFVTTIGKWYAVHRRDLPWRDLWHLSENDRAYRVLVSEVMLQQTQVERVKIVFMRFLERFPDIVTLAVASNRDVILAWRGMGYNSRALRLRDAARFVMEHHHGIIPSSMEELRRIPGIGHYTAAAVRNFAFGIPTPCLDVNIRRVLHRTFVGCENADGTWRRDDRYLLKLAGEVLEVALESCHSSLVGSLLDERRFIERRATSDWHAALMDYGSLVQKKTHPQWEQCWLTERGIMIARPETFQKMLQQRSRSADLRSRENSHCKEPGRFVGSRYVPNRIFRGKIVEELRDAPEGLTLGEIGKRVCIDWDPKMLSGWLEKLLEGLNRDHLLKQRQIRFYLS